MLSDLKETKKEEWTIREAGHSGKKGRKKRKEGDGGGRSSYR